jgi:hypothetical protein
MEKGATDMSDDFIDPLKDPRWPDRPQHRDFWRMSECILRIDGQATEGGESVEDILGVDMNSFMYVAKSRTDMARERIGMLPARPGGQLEMLLMSVYMDAFALGKLYAEHPSTRYEEEASASDPLSVLLAEGGWRINRLDDDRFVVLDPAGQEVIKVWAIGVGAQSVEAQVEWAHRWWYDEGGEQAAKRGKQDGEGKSK